jgi:AcrR family transcriptional regulator
MSTSTATPSGQEASARQRLLAAADELFYNEGVHSVGIDRVIDHAGVAKASLYRLFGSKENLIASYLAVRHERNIAEMRRAVADCDDPRDAILAIFDVQARWLRLDTFRGCPFARATAEPSVGSSVHDALAAYRGAIFQLFEDLAHAAGADDPDMLAAQLQTLYHGTDTVLTSSRKDNILDATRVAVQTLLEASCEGPS